jgi:hypothetical protein
MSSTASSVAESEVDEVMENEHGNRSQTELERIKTECSAMVQLLKNLEDEEHNLDCQLKILAREALMCGFAPDVVEPPQPKRRRTAWKAAVAKKKEATASSEADATSVAETTLPQSETTPAASVEVVSSEAVTKEAVDTEDVDETPSAS